MDAAVRERARAVRLVAVFDVDGVLTDGTLYLTDGGEEIKAFNTLDGHGLKMLMGAGVETAIITARTSRVVERRARDLGIARLHQGAHDKRAVFESLCRELGIGTAAASYMGDTGYAEGTVGYMSPEQARGEPQDGRSDLFSLGTVLYEAARDAPVHPIVGARDRGGDPPRRAGVAPLAPP